MQDCDQETNAAGPAPNQTRRAFIKTVAYITPAILTLGATPARAQHGSSRFKEWAWQDENGNWRWGPKP